MADSGIADDLAAQNVLTNRESLSRPFLNRYATLITWTTSVTWRRRFDRARTRGRGGQAAGILHGISKGIRAGVVGGRGIGDLGAIIGNAHGAM